MANREEGERIRKWIAQNADGMTLEEAAKSCGASQGQVRHCLTTMGIPIEKISYRVSLIRVSEDKALEWQNGREERFDYLAHFIRRNHMKMNQDQIAEKMDVCIETIKIKAKAIGCELMKAPTRDELAIINFQREMRKRIKYNPEAQIAWERIQGWIKRGDTEFEDRMEELLKHNNEGGTS